MEFRGSEACFDFEGSFTATVMINDFYRRREWPPADNSWLNILQKQLS